MKTQNQSIITDTISPARQRQINQRHSANRVSSPCTMQCGERTATTLLLLQIVSPVTINRSHTCTVHTYHPNLTPNANQRRPMIAEAHQERQQQQQPTAVNRPPGSPCSQLNQLIYDRREQLRTVRHHHLQHSPTDRSYDSVHAQDQRCAIAMRRV